QDRLSWRAARSFPAVGVSLPQLPSTIESCCPAWISHRPFLAGFAFSQALAILYDGGIRNQESLAIRRSEVTERSGSSREQCLGTWWHRIHATIDCCLCFLGPVARRVMDLSESKF